MSRFLITIALILFTYVFVKGQTQVELNKSASDAVKQAESELNEVYLKIQEEYADDSTFLVALETAQANWIAYKQTELELKYPNRPPGWYGSIHSMCIALYAAELIRERTARLRVWIDGVEAGDGCAGSVRAER